MAILIDKNSKVLVTGLTGRIGSFHAQEMRDYGTNVVGGVTPGKGGMVHNGLPVFNTVKGAVAETGADMVIAFVPPPFAADSIMEAADAGIRTCICIADGIPTQDMIRVKRYMRRYKAENRMRLIGPNCAGIITPGQGFAGLMPPHIYLPGRVGIIGRSGTLGYEAASQMKASASAAIRSTDRASATFSSSSRMIPRPMPWSSSARSAARKRPRPRNISAIT